ncbi:magnesium transporter [Talaromyces proteolyticus]|uniref:Magnesium transporter n=1 Tax=Talaromyces proteolyticus TaxID=1131652 RepID=A0AAD4L059_9EURO|nr:magnesium transporter [Talaromyces proteolyticus]KAH8703808.1 magnesium transporter [Talaromyces proteolyticus]
MDGTHDKFTGMALAMLSSVAIGSSYVITKKSLMQSSDRHGFDGSGFSYVKNPLWWCGTITLVSGELMNTVAYAFAPAVLVTPLGALSVLIGAVLGAYFLQERLNTVGRIGCATCLLGSILLVLHAPADPEIETITEIFKLATKPFFLLYLFFVVVYTLYAAIRLAPSHGKSNPLVYISICSLMGSISVMSVKAFGIAVRLTVEGSNQFANASTYVFLIALVVTTVSQTHYLNKAMSHFPASLVNAIFYVGFTTCTLSASFIFYQGINTDDPTNILSLICGFLLDFMGVAILTLSKNADSLKLAKSGYRAVGQADDDVELERTD